MAIDWEGFNKSINMMLKFAMQKKLLDYRDLQRLGYLKESEAMYGRLGEERLGREKELVGVREESRKREDIFNFWLGEFKKPEVDFMRSQTRYLNMFGEDPEAARISEEALGQILESQTRAHEAAQMGKVLPTEDIRTGVTALPPTERMGLTREIGTARRQKERLALQREKEGRLKKQAEEKAKKEPKDKMLQNLLQKEKVMSRQFKDLLAADIDFEKEERARTALNKVREKIISRLDITMFSQEEISKNQTVANEIKADANLLKIFMNPSTNELLDGELLRRKLERNGFDLNLIRLLIEQQ